jgi:hypothetical protein
MLNALAAQHFGEYLSDEDKRAALEKVLADIEHEKYPQQYEPPAQAKGAGSTTEPVRHPF